MTTSSQRWWATSPRTTWPHSSRSCGHHCNCLLPTLQKSTMCVCCPAVLEEGSPLLHRLLVCSPTYMLALHGGGRCAEATLVRWCAGQRSTWTVWTKVRSSTGSDKKSIPLPKSVAPDRGSVDDVMMRSLNYEKSSTINQRPAQCQPHSFSIGGQIGKQLDAVVPGLGGPAATTFGALLLFL